MKTFKEHLLESTKENIIDNGYRYGSIMFFDVISTARQHLKELSDTSISILETDIGLFGDYNGKDVPLDLPLISESIELDSPKRGGSKKFYVYTKDKNGKVIKVEFGDTSGLNVKFNDPVKQASFSARHKCHEKTDRTTAGYWSCNLPKYAKQLGLSGGGDFYW